MRAPLLVLVLVALTLFGPSGCGGGSGRGEFSVRSIGEMPGDSIVPVALNDSGQVAAEESGGGSPEADIGRAFVWNDGAIKETGTFGGTWSHAADINNSGTVVGYAYALGGDKGDPAHGFLFHNGVLTDLTPSANSRASGINDQGDVVGYIERPEGYRGTLWHGGQATDLPNLPGFEGSLPLDINNTGTILGIARNYSEPFKTHSYVVQNGALRDLGTLGGMYTIATRINNNSEVVGTSYTSKSVDPGGTYQNTPIHRAFLWRNGVMTDLGTLGGKSSDAYGINDHGWVVGTAETDSTAIIGSLAPPFLYRNGKMTDLNKLIDPGSGWVLYSAIAINNHNQILAIGNKGACLLTPR